MIELLVLIAVVGGALWLAGALLWTGLKFALWVCGGVVALFGGMFVLLFAGGLLLIFAPILAVLALGAFLLPALLPLILGAVLGYWYARQRAASAA